MSSRQRSDNVIARNQSLTQASILQLVAKFKISFLTKASVAVALLTMQFGYEILFAPDKTGVVHSNRPEVPIQDNKGIAGMANQQE